MPHTTLTVEEERPCPRGLAKGLLKGRPIDPLTRGGNALARKAAPQKNEKRINQAIPSLTLLVSLPRRRSGRRIEDVIPGTDLGFTRDPKLYAQVGCSRLGSEAREPATYGHRGRRLRAASRPVFMGSGLAAARR